MRDKDGKANGTNREWLEGYAKRLAGAGNENTAAKVRKAMRGPECPVLMAHVWRWFLALSNMREWGEGGPKAIRATEIAAWASLTGANPTPREVRLILDLDVKFRNVHAEDENDIPRMPEADQAMLEWAKAARMSTAMG